MSLLDLQTMETETEHPEDLNGGGGGASTVSLLSCISAASVVLCV